jgi:hypothetical protein
MQLSLLITLSTEPVVTATAHAIIYGFVTAEAGLQHPDIPYGTCGEQSIRKIVFL